MGKVAAYSTKHMVFVFRLGFIVTYESEVLFVQILDLWKSMLRIRPTQSSSPHGFPVAKTSDMKMIQTLVRVERKATSEQHTPEKQQNVFTLVPHSRELC